MRNLSIAITVAAAITASILVTTPGHAEGPDTDARESLSQLALAGAPLVPEPATSLEANSTPSFSNSPSSIVPPPAGPAAAPASDSVPPPELGPQVDPQLPDIPVPNPLDIFNNLDPSKWAGDILNAVLTTIGQALLEAIRGFVDWATGFGGSSLNFVTQTPAAGTYDSPTVHSLWDFSRALVNLALAVIVMWGGFNIIVKEHTRSPYHEVMELLPRLILAALAANLTLEFARGLIDANNAVSAAVGQVALPGYDQATPEQEGMALIFTALAYGIVALLLALQMLMRLALIDVLIVLAPIAALLWVLPQTQSWAHWWADLFPITVFQQAIQMMVLRLGSALMVELTPGSISNALLTLMLGIAVCWLTLKVPSLLRSRRSQGSLFDVLTFVVASRTLGALGAVSRGGGSAARSGRAGAGGKATAGA